MTSIAAYCRVSTDREDQSNSFESQQRYFREYIRNHPGWELYNIYADEGVTGTSTKRRTQFNRMISDAYDGKFQLILTKEVSRFSRNILDTIAYTRELRAIGVGVIFVNDRINTLQSDAEMMLSIFASLAQEESRRTSSRVVWGQTRQMEKGIVFGRSLLGYDVKNGNMTINEEGARIVRLIFYKYALEQVGTSEIMRYLIHKGYRTCRGNTQWSSSAIIRILNNEKYAGDLVQKKSYTPDYLSHEKRRNNGTVPYVIIRNHHEPIISRELWNMAQERLQKNRKHSKQALGHSNRYVFSGKIKCGECGSSFVGRFRYRKDGTKIRRWSCGLATRAGTGSCAVGKLIRDDDAMLMLKTAIRSLSACFGAVVGNVTELALDTVQKSEGGKQEEFQRLALDIERIQRKKEAVMDSYFSGEIKKEDMQAMTQKYDRQSEEIRLRESEMTEIGVEHKDPTIMRETIREMLSGILNGELESEVFYKTLLDSLTVFQDRHMELRLNHLPQVFWFLG